MHHIHIFSFYYLVLGKFGTFQQTIILGIMVLIACLVIKPASAKINEEKINIKKRLNYGVVFKQESFLYMSTESWLHTFQVQLPKKVTLSKMSMCTKSTNECNSLNSMVNYIHSLHDSTESQLLETIRAIHTLAPQTNYFNIKRNERSLLPFIGSLAKGIFGLATMGDVSLLAQHINALNRRSQLMANTLQQHGSHLSSFMSLMDNRTTNLMNGVQQNAAEIQKVTHTFYNSLSSFQDSMTNMSKILITLVNNANILRESLNQLQASIQSLVEGRISPFLIPKQILTHSLHKIQSIMSKSYPGFYLTHFDPNYYYTHSNFIYARNHSILYITVRFPVSAHAKPLNLYKIISLPVPINKTSSHATKLMSLPNYFAITSRKDYYTALSTEDLTNCVHGSTVFCTTNLQLTPVTMPSCMIALFTNNVTMVKQLCNFRFLQDHLTHSVVELTKSSVLVYKNNNDLTLKCPDNNRKIPSCSFCVVHVPCMCSLSSPTLYYAPRLINCYDEATIYTSNTSSSSALHPVNLALLSEFFDQAKLKNILGDTTFPSHVSMKIPDFKIYSHNMSKILVADRQDHLSLRKMAKAAKKDEQIFKTLTEPLLTGDINLNSQWPDLNAILIFIALSIGILSFITCVYLFFKVRKMATAMLILQQVASVKSQTVPSFIYNEKVTESTTVDNGQDIITYFTNEFSWIHASVLLSIIVLVILIIIIVCLYKKNKRHSGTNLAIEITCGGECVIVNLLSLSLCPSYWNIENPVINRISISPFPSCKLFTTWSKFNVTNKLTSQSISVPTTISLNFITWYKLRKILRQPFCAYVMIIHNGYCTLLPNQDGVNDSIPKNSLYPQL